MDNEPLDTTKPAKPDNYLVWAILSTVMCCLPFGIASIVYSSKVDSLYASGQYAEAQAAADNAKKWAKIAAIVGGVVALLYVIFIVVIGVGVGMNGDF